MKRARATIEKPVSTRSLIDIDTATLPWETVRACIEKGDIYWLSSVRPDGRPHTVPILAVWTDGALHFAAGESTRKARNLAWNAHCAIALRHDGFDLVLEGKVARECDNDRLTTVADAYAAKYGWHVTVREGAFQDTEGAPTAGPPPYEVYRVEPTTVFAFGTDEATMAASTRWRF